MTHWDRADFNALKAGWSSERQTNDLRLLRKIFALATDSPLLAQELAWAHQHDIAFFIDYKASKEVTGYYSAGTGVMALHPSVLNNPADAVNTLAHELRHAWQDYHGFGRDRTLRSFYRDFATQAILEADAEAYGERAREQYEVTQMKRRGEKVPYRYKDAFTNQSANLARNFLSWFETPGFTHFYGARASIAFGLRAGVGPEKNLRQSLRGGNLGLSFVPSIDYAQTKLDIDTLPGLRALGLNFTGNANYMTAIPSETLLKNILSPSLVENFWNTATVYERSLTTEFRKAMLRKKFPDYRYHKHFRKLHQRLRKVKLSGPKHPWP